jgi:hypothetical protein
MLSPRTHTQVLYSMFLVRKPDHISLQIDVSGRAGTAGKCVVEKVFALECCGLALARSRCTKLQGHTHWTAHMPVQESQVKAFQYD